MQQTCRAIYENGVLKPLDHLDLDDHAEVRVVVSTGESAANPTQGTSGFPTFAPPAGSRKIQAGDVERALEDPA